MAAGTAGVTPFFFTPAALLVYLRLAPAPRSCAHAWPSGRAAIAAAPAAAADRLLAGYLVVALSAGRCLRWSVANARACSLLDDGVAADAARDAS